MSYAPIKTGFQEQYKYTPSMSTKIQEVHKNTRIKMLAFASLGSAVALLETICVNACHNDFLVLHTTLPYP